ncbi:hypothetical protein BDZ89DRAFT_363821 [Hymenopellis radicata]|nr:hypothetical protein BDZ89DRAFT_363821 [Hymenopellis radicata]
MYPYLGHPPQTRALKACVLRAISLYNTVAKIFYLVSSFYILFIMLIVYPYRVFWAFSIILESICVLPQLILLRQTVPTSSSSAPIAVSTSNGFPSKSVVPLFSAATPKFYTICVLMNIVARGFGMVAALLMLLLEHPHLR